MKRGGKNKTMHPERVSPNETHLFEMLPISDYLTSPNVLCSFQMVRHHRKSKLPNVETLSIEDKVSTTKSSPPSPRGNVAIMRTHTFHKRLPIHSGLETSQSKAKLTRPRAQTRPALKLRTTDANVGGMMFLKTPQQNLGNKRICAKTVRRNPRLMTAPLSRRMNTAIT
uniref:Tyrosine-protein kinase n=1 Tax=Parascaris univalens TaxID=6257 RepID=A0A915AQG2_PARUN